MGSGFALGLRYVSSCCCCLCCLCLCWCFFFPFFLQFSIIFAFACCSCCFCCCCIVRFFAAFSSLAVAQSIYCPALVLLLLCFTTPPPPCCLLISPSPHYSRFLLATCHAHSCTLSPLPCPTNRLSHLTLCVFSIAMPFNFLARPTTLRKPPGQPHLLQPHLPLPPPSPFCLAAFLGLQFCAIYGYGFSSVNF